jgi:hypothetical protein
LLPVVILRDLHDRVIWCPDLTGRVQLEAVVGNLQGEQSMDVDRATPVVISMAKELITAMQRISPGWQRAYWRFVSVDGRYGSNASYSAATEVTLISTLKESQLFERLNNFGRELWNSEPDPSRRFRVCLLVVTSDLDYEIKFEQHDEKRWRITKLDGQSGLPDGL